MDRFNLNLFFALDAILHAKTLTDAARAVHLSQSALSSSLKKLRESFDDELVTYQPGMPPRYTLLALALKPRIRAIVEASRTAARLTLSFDPAADERQLRVTAADILELMFVSRVMSDIARHSPGIEIVSVPFAYQPVDELLRGDVDVAIVSEAFASPAYPIEPLFDETISCLVWNGSVHSATMTEAQYFAARHAAMYFSPERVSQPVTAALYQLNLQRDITIRASVYSALPRMIVGTDLIVTTLTRFAHLCAETLPVRVIPAPVETPVISFVAQWQSHRSDEPAIQWLVDQMRQVAADAQT